jgi:hypothetical protein
MSFGNKHENYEILNLLGYGLAKFDYEFIKQFGFKTKTTFFKYFVELGIVKTGSVVKNRMDLFDPFFDNDRKGWWQKGNAYIHRKHLIDNLFGNENVTEYSNIVKLFLKEKYRVKDEFLSVKPIIKTRFKKMQETGLEAELFFMNNFTSIDMFDKGVIEDARLYGDGYDFQISTISNSYLAEIKGIRAKHGNFRLTENEYSKAEEYKEDYVITIVKNLDNIPFLISIPNPLSKLKFEEKTVMTKERKEYHLIYSI